MTIPYQPTIIAQHQPEQGFKYDGSLWVVLKFNDDQTACIENVLSGEVRTVHVTTQIDAIQTINV